MKCLYCLSSENRSRSTMWSVSVFVLIFASLTSAFVLEGSQSSYAQFRKWYSTWNATVELEFLTDNKNGVLLYTDDGGYYDFFELKLVDGSLRLRFNLGGGTKVLSVGKDLCDGKAWHKVQVRFLLLLTHWKLYTYLISWYTL